MSHQDHNAAAHADLTKNQTLVFGALSKADGPLSAYTILDQLRGAGFRAPLQVYRALGKLVEIGIVHRLESLNAFVACRHPHCDSRDTIAFTICEACDRVAEINDGRLERSLKLLAEKGGFALSKSTVELRGLCLECQAV